MNKAEVVVWKHLRLLRQQGYVFRRQHPIGPYIADFAIHSGTLVIELDGDTHDQTVEHDQIRDAYLRSRGWRVLRIPNMAVYEDIDVVIDAILSKVPPPARSHRSLATSPASGGG
jgi:very-short-patch-repair endonuclease